MSNTFKIVLVLLVAASIVSSVLAVFAFIGKEREYMKRVMLEDKLSVTVKEKKNIEKELNANKQILEESEANIQDLKNKINKVTAEMEDVKKNNQVVVQDLEDKGQEIEKLKLLLVKEKKEKSAISQKLADIEFEYDKAKKGMERIEKERMSLQKEISDLKQKAVNLDPIVVNPSSGNRPQSLSDSPWQGSALPPKEALSGKVLVVNRDYSFVVTDLGQGDGVQTGMMFEIMDGSKLMGKAKVEKIYDTMSSATVLPGADIDNIKKGNLVIESH